MGLELWLSLIGGLICVFLGLRFIDWALTTVTGGTFNTGFVYQQPVNESDPPAGTPVAYFDLKSFTSLPSGDYAWQEMGYALFGIALLLQALALFAGYSMPKLERPALFVALALTVVALLANVVVIVQLMGIGVTPLMSMIVLLFGGFLLFTLIARVRETSASSYASMA